MKQELEQWLNRSVDLIRLHPYLHPEFKARIEREVIYICTGGRNGDRLPPSGSQSLIRTH